MADTKISALTELTAPVSGDYIPIVDTSAAATKKIDWSIVGSPTITPEHYGCVGDGVADDTVNLQAAIDATIAANGSLKGTGTYRVTSTILISPGTEII